MAQPSSSFSEKFNAATPAGAERVMSESGMRATFEDLWKQGKVDTSDLWNQRRFWEGRDTLLGKGEKPGLEESANGAAETANNIEPSNEFIAQPDPIAAAVNAMNPQPRQTLEQGLNDMLERPMDSGNFNFDDFARDPQNYQQEYLSKISPENRALFEQRLTEVGGAGAESTINHAAEDDLETGLVNENSMAFLAVALGSGEAGRVHEYLRSRDNGSTLAGIGSSNDEDSEEAKTRRAIESSSLASNMINNITQEIAAIDLRIGDIDNQLEELREEMAKTLQDINEAEERLANTRQELEEATAERDAAQGDVTTTQESIDTIQSHQAAMEESIANGTAVITDERDVIYEYTDESGQTVNYKASADGELTLLDEAPPEAMVCYSQELPEIVAVRAGQREQLQELESSRDAAQQRLFQSQEKVSDLERQYLEIESELQLLNDKYQGQQQQESELTDERTALLDRREALENELNAAREQDQNYNLSATLHQNRYETTQASMELDVEIASLATRSNELSEQIDSWGYANAAEAFYTGEMTSEHAALYEEYIQTAEDIDSKSRDLENLDQKIENYDSQIAELETRIQELETQQAQITQELDTAEQAEQEAIEQAGSAHERRLTNWRGETVYEDERFGGMGLSYEDAETGEIKQHGLVASVAGQAAHAWQDFWKDDAQTGNQIDEVTEKAAAASETRQQTAEQLEQTTAELQAVREQQAELAARQRAMGAESAPAASLENTSRYSAVAARSELAGAPEGGKLSSAFGDAVNGTTETPQTDLPAPAPLTNEQNLQLATNSM